MLEAIVVNLLTTGLVAGASVSHDKVRGLLRRRQFSEDIDDIATEFNRALRDAVRDVAERQGTEELTTIALYWNDVAAELDEIDIVFESETDAVERIVDAIETARDEELTEAGRQDLEQAVTEAYTQAVTEFENRVAGTELGTVLETEANIHLARQLDELQNRLDELEQQLAPPRRYTVFDAQSEQQAAIETVTPAKTVAFVDRPEATAARGPGKHLIAGPAGSGKTSLLGAVLQRLDTETIEHILIPGKELNYPGDAESLERETFDGDVLLVWDDIHRINEARDNRVFEDVVTKLEANLTEDGYELHALVAARSGNLDDLPGDVEDSTGLWGEFDIIRLDAPSPEDLEQIIDRLGAFYDVDIPEEIREYLIEHGSESPSAPIYIDSVLSTAEGGRLTRRQVASLPPSEAVGEIWEQQYDHLEESNDEALVVLEACKLLYDIGLPLSPPLVQAVYQHVLGGEKREFRRAVEALIERQWLAVPDETDLLDANIEYTIHDTQLEAVDQQIGDWIQEFSSFLWDQMDDRLLRGTGYQPPRVHESFAFAVADERRRGALDAEAGDSVLIEHFSEAVEYRLETGDIAGAITRLNSLEAYGLGRDLIPIELYERTLDAVADTPLEETDEHEHALRQLRIDYAAHSYRDPSESIQELYRYGLEETYAPKHSEAMITDAGFSPSGTHQFFGCWTERNRLASDSDAYLLAVAAGIWVAAFEAEINPIRIDNARMGIEFSLDETEIREAVDNNRDRLSPPVLAVYTWALTDETAPKPEALREQLAPDDDRQRREIDVYEAFRSMSHKQDPFDWEESD